ncbi:MAG: formyl transferase [Ignavibacteriales bacterium]|nr:formyl transferase [Ignavibacteriales bacterium]
MLKILLVTQDDPFYVSIFFKELFKHSLTEKFELVGVIIQPPLGKKSMKKLIKQMFNFYGFWNFLSLGIKYVVYKIFNLVSVKLFSGNFPGFFSVKHILLKKKIKIFELKNINSKESLDFLRSFNLDIIFSIAASQIFKDDVLNLPELGCFNIHTSRLPKNRGMMPNFWSLLNFENDPISAVTIHKMNKELDDGEILFQQHFDLDPKESLDSLIRRTKKLSVNVFLEAIKILKNGEVNFLVNDSRYATYNTFPTKDDVKRFRTKGYRLR